MKDICCVTPKKGSLTNEQVTLQHLEFLFFFSKFCCLLPFSMLPVLRRSSPTQSWGIEDYQLLCPFEDFDWQGWSRTLSKPTACKETVVGADISPKQNEDMLIMYITYVADHVVSCCWRGFQEVPVVKTHTCMLCPKKEKIPSCMPLSSACEKVLVINNQTVGRDLAVSWMASTHQVLPWVL